MHGLVPARAGGRAAPPLHVRPVGQRKKRALRGGDGRADRSIGDGEARQAAVSLWIGCASVSSGSTSARRCQGADLTVPPSPLGCLSCKSIRIVLMVLLLVYYILHPCSF
jgi:hypothetical protein